MCLCGWVDFPAGPQGAAGSLFCCPADIGIPGRSALQRRAARIKQADQRILRFTHGGVSQSAENGFRHKGLRTRNNRRFIGACGREPIAASKDRCDRSISLENGFAVDVGDREKMDHQTGEDDQPIGRARRTRRICPRSYPLQLNHTPARPLKWHFWLKTLIFRELLRPHRGGKFHVQSASVSALATSLRRHATLPEACFSCQTKTSS